MIGLLASMAFAEHVEASLAEGRYVMTLHAAVASEGSGVRVDAVRHHE